MAGDRKFNLAIGHHLSDLSIDEILNDRYSNGAPTIASDDCLEKQQVCFHHRGCCPKTLPSTDGDDFGGDSLAVSKNTTLTKRFQNGKTDL